MKKLFERVLQFLIISSLLALVLTWVCGYVDPRSFWPASFPALFFPYIYVLSLFVALWALWKKNLKGWLIIIALVITSSTFRSSFFNISINSTSTPGYTLMTHNIGSSLEKNKKPDFTFYKSNKADVLCFQEWNEKTNARYIKDSIKTYYKYNTLSQHPNLWPIFSQYPILKQGVLPSKSKGNGITWADLAMATDTIRLYNIHLISNRISSQTEEIMHAENINNKNFIDRIKKILVRYRNALLLRTDQAVALLEHASQSKYPVLIAGDFNDIPSSYVFRLFSKTYKDAFKASGTGMAYTYAGSLPFLAIDHILYSKSIQCHTIKIKRQQYSDHFPVKVSFANF